MIFEGEMNRKRVFLLNELDDKIINFNEKSGDLEELLKNKDLKKNEAIIIGVANKEEEEEEELPNKLTLKFEKSEIPITKKEEALYGLENAEIIGYDERRNPIYRQKTKTIYSIPTSIVIKLENPIYLKGERIEKVKILHHNSAGENFFETFEDRVEVKAGLTDKERKIAESIIKGKGFFTITGLEFAEEEFDDGVDIENNTLILYNFFDELREATYEEIKESKNLESKVTDKEIKKTVEEIKNVVLGINNLEGIRETEFIISKKRIKG